MPRLLLVGLALGCLSFAGCGTFSDAICGPATDHVFYRGVRLDLMAVEEGGPKILMGADIPFSAVVDTLLVPYLAYRELTDPPRTRPVQNASQGPKVDKPATTAPQEIDPAVAALIRTLPPIPELSDAEKSLAALPGFKGYKVDAYIAAAASLQAAGKEKAAVLLTEFAGGSLLTDREQLAVLCRMLFTAKPTGEFRHPGLGAPFFIGPIVFKDWPTVFSEWPLAPIELVDGIPFLVVHGHMTAGYPERASDYLDYCLKNCDWNTEAFKPKTAEEKRKALAKLLASPKWNGPLTDDAKKSLSSQIE